MPIRIKTGVPAQYGRITMPQGTFLTDPFSNQQPLSNPSAAFNGLTNGYAGTTPGFIGQPQGAQPLYTPGNYASAAVQKGFNWKGFLESILYTDMNKASQIFGPGALSFMQAQNTAMDEIRNSVQSQAGAPTNVFSPPTLTSPSNSLVGRDPTNEPNILSMQTLQQIFAGRSPQEISDAMMQNGYIRRYEMGSGEFFVKATTGAGDMTSLTDSRGRPSYVDGASLAQGERVTSASGVSYVGGTPYTNKETGETVGQYAITLPGVKNDPHGKFKWTSTVVKDDSGNFVRIYRQQLRKVYTKRARELRAYRAERDAAQPEQTPESQGIAANQLVSLRAQYG